MAVNASDQNQDQPDKNIEDLVYLLANRDWTDDAYREILLLIRRYYTGKIDTITGAHSLKEWQADKKTILAKLNQNLQIVVERNSAEVIQKNPSLKEAIEFWSNAICYCRAHIERDNHDDNGDSYEEFRNHSVQNAECAENGDFMIKHRAYDSKHYSNWIGREGCTYSQKSTMDVTINGNFKNLSDIQVNFNSEEGGHIFKIQTRNLIDSLSVEGSLKIESGILGEEEKTKDQPLSYLSDRLEILCEDKQLAERVAESTRFLIVAFGGGSDAF